MWKIRYKPSVCVVLAAVAFMPAAALAQLPPLPPLPGGPPPFGAGGPPPAPGVGGPAIHPGAVAVPPRADVVAGVHGTSPIGGPAGFRAGSRGATFGYGHSGSVDHLSGGWRHAHARVYGRGNDDYVDDGCYYVYRRYRRDLVCD